MSDFLTSSSSLYSFNHSISDNFILNKALIHELNLMMNTSYERCQRQI